MPAEEKPKKESGVEAPPIPRLKERYLAEIVPSLMRAFGYHNIMEAPRLSKIVISMGVGAATQDPKALDGAVEDLALIAGQRPNITRSKRSIAQFRVRQNNPIGCKVTLRHNRMYEFLDRFISVALPRIRDFRGLSRNAFDGRGNYSFGLDDQLIFPELGYDDIERQRGMSITFTTTARNDEEARALLELLGTPFAK